MFHAAIGLCILCPPDIFCRAHSYTPPHVVLPCIRFDCVFVCGCTSNDMAKRKSLDSNAIVFGTSKGGNLDKDRLQSLYGDCIKLANEVLSKPRTKP